MVNDTPTVNKYITQRMLNILNKPLTFTHQHKKIHRKWLGKLLERLHIVRAKYVLDTDAPPIIEKTLKIVRAQGLVLPTTERTGNHNVALCMLLTIW